jgi:hypothetical protein
MKSPAALLFCWDAYAISKVAQNFLNRSDRHSVDHFAGATYKELHTSSWTFRAWLFSLFGRGLRSANPYIEVAKQSGGVSDKLKTCLEPGLIENGR